MRRSATTTSSSPSAPGSPSSASRGRPSTRSPCTRWPTRSGCGTTCSQRWDEADRDPSLVDDGALNVVVVGGGPTGIETAGALAELYRSNFAEDYPAIPQDQARIILVEAGPALLSMFAPSIRSYTKKALEKRGVEVMLGEVVSLGRADPGHAEVGHGPRRPHAGLGRRPAGQPARRRPRRRPAAAATASRPSPDLSLDGPARGVRGGRHRLDHRHEDRRRAAAARLGRAPGRRAGRARTSPAWSRARTPSRSRTTTRGRWRRSAGARRSSRPRAGTRSRARPPSLAWGAVHLALLSTGEDRAKAVVDWTWAGFTHERSGRISVRTDTD